MGNGSAARTEPRRTSAGRAHDVRQRLVARITSCWQTQALAVAVQLELPDRLSAGPEDAEELAATCDCSVDGLRRLLRALCALQVCRERADGRFELTAAGDLLCRVPTNGATSLRAMALWWGGPLWPMWGDLAYSVRTGSSARARRTGLEHYAFLEESPAVAALFHETMQALTSLIVEDVASLELWRAAAALVDVGGGHGELAAGIAAAHAKLRVTVLDREDARTGALAVFAGHGLADRGQFVPGDFFLGVPHGADVYLLKSILHNWDDADCRRILARCAEAAGRGARLLVVERVRPERLRARPRDQALARTDLNMLAGLGGRERSVREFAALLEPAGFTIGATVATRHEFTVIDARRR